jgi:putative hydrolase of the HAD superfamily
LGIKAVIFDLDGTLYTSEGYTRHLMKGIVETLAELFSMSKQDAFKLLQDLRARYGSITLGVKSLGMEKSEFYRRLVEKLAPEKFIAVRPELLDLLEELRMMGFKLACHTNASKALAEKVLGALGVPPEIFNVLVTCDDAEPKPMPEGYLKIVKALGLRPNEILYVGDRWGVELEPAKRLGMRTALVAEKPQGEPGLVIRDVLELREKLKFLDDP